MPNIASWLTKLGLAKYVGTFVSNEVDLDALKHLRESDLKKFGLPLGPRRKIMKGIRALQAATRLDIPRSNAKVDPAPTQAERRQLTIMFVDLIGSTELSQQLDPEDLRDVLRSYQSTVSAEVLRYEGHVAKLMGDGVLVYFGWPKAHENDAERAVRAGLAITSAVADLVTPSAQHLSVRIGIATGLVVVGDLVGEGSAQEEAVVGETPNLAARLQGLAEPNRVVISHTTRKLVGGLFDLVDLGQREVKGFARAVHAWEIQGEAELDDRFAALHRHAPPLVGRGQELQYVCAMWDQAKSGKGQVLLLSGEPGIGKSRLVAALYEEIESDPHVRLRYFCSPYFVSTPLYPVIEQLRRAAGIQVHDDGLTKLDKLEGSIREIAPHVDELAPFLSELLSIDAGGRYPSLKLSAQARKARTLGALMELLGALAARQPVLMVVEDAHWVDPTTSEWLDMAISASEKLPIFLVISFRPEFQPPWNMGPHLRALSLNRLSQDHAAELADRTAGKALPQEIRSQILAKTEGVPLFVEELTRSLLESGLLVEAHNHYVLSGPLTAFPIPLTLQDSLMARLDRLGRFKTVAQTGACLGRAFSHRLIAAVIGSDNAELARDLQQLEAAALIFRQGVPPDALYTFKHALVQEAAYQSLLKSRRQQIHARIATVIEQKFSAIAEAEPETLARHLVEGGLAEKASPYWLMAGRQALKRSANIEALRHLKRGLELLPAIPKSEAQLRLEIELQSSMGVALMATKGWGAPQVLQAFSKARTLSEELRDEHQMFVALCGEASYHMISGNLQESDQLGRQCVELAHHSDDANLVLEAHHRQWATKYFLGEYDAAEMHANAGIRTYDAHRHHPLTYVYTGHDPGVCCRMYSGLILWLRGYPDQALHRCQEALRLAEQVNHPLSIQLAQYRLSTVYLLRGELDDARRHIDKSITLAKEFGFALSIAEAEFQLGCVLGEAGSLSEGVEMMRKALASIGKSGAGVALQEYLCHLARLCGEIDVNEGLDLIEHALAIATASTVHQLPEILRTKGDLLLKRDPGDRSAEDLFRQATATAKDARTKSLELRATVSLARRQFSSGPNDEAHDRLSHLYNWFSEGLGTHDLTEARKLLESSSRVHQS